MLPGQVARQHHTNLVGEYLFARIVDNAAAVAVAVEGKAHIRLVLQHGITQGVQHLHIFRVRIIAREGEVELAVERDDFSTDLCKDLRHEGTGGAVAAGRDDLELAADGGTVRKVGDVAGAHVVDIGVSAAGPCLALTPQHDGLEAGHLVRAEGQRTVRPHFHPGPAVFIVAGRHHGDAGHIQRELREIGDRRKCQADVMNLNTGSHQPGHQRLLDAR